MQIDYNSFILIISFWENLKNRRNHGFHKVAVKGVSSFPPDFSWLKFLGSRLRMTKQLFKKKTSIYSHERMLNKSISLAIPNENKFIIRFFREIISRKNKIHHGRNPVHKVSIRERKYETSL